MRVEQRARLFIQENFYVEDTARLEDGAFLIREGSWAPQSIPRIAAFVAKKREGARAAPRGGAAPARVFLLSRLALGGGAVIELIVSAVGLRGGRLRRATDERGDEPVTSGASRMPERWPDAAAVVTLARRPAYGELDQCVHALAVTAPPAACAAGIASSPPSRTRLPTT